MCGYSDLIDTLWNVKANLYGVLDTAPVDLIDTLWNVKLYQAKQIASYNDLIDTLWNVKFVS